VVLVVVVVETKAVLLETRHLHHQVRETTVELVGLVLALELLLVAVELVPLVQTHLLQVLVALVVLEHPHLLLAQQLLVAVAVAVAE
jgi:hypothetical protein